MCEDFWLLHLDNAPSHTSFFTREFFIKNMTVFSTHPTFLFSPLKVKQKGRHFYAFETIEAESQSVLNTFTEHDFQDVFMFQSRPRR
jgi:hypothetical protein